MGRTTAKGTYSERTPEAMANDIFSEQKQCPMCHKETDWGSMIWLNGQWTCPGCYAIKRAELDASMAKNNNT